MSKLKNIVLPVIMVSFIGCNIAYANPTEDRLKTQQSQLKSDSEKLSDTQNSIQSTEVKIEKLDNSIQKTMLEINNNKQQIASVNKEIQAADEQVKIAQANLDKEIEIYGKRVRAIYLNGTDNMLEALLDAEGFSDFLSRVQIVSKLADLDKKIVSEITASQNEVVIKKNQLNEKKSKLVNLNRENDIKMSKLTEEKNQQQVLIKKAKDEEKLYASKVDASKAQVNQTLKEIEEMKKRVPKYDPANGAAPISDDAIVVYAYGFRGTPYLWGGTTPAGFDCSGFTQYVYKHFGIRIGRTTYDQINDGVAVSKDQLKPGDLILFGSQDDAHHVGMYVGNGSFIHAPRTGDVIKVQALSSRGDYLTARRVR